MANKRDRDKGGREQTAAANGVALRPGFGADAPADVERCIGAEVRELYEVYSYRHAVTILANSFQNELNEILEALLAFRITKKDIGMPGGNESSVPKKFSQFLWPKGWVESRIQGDLLVKVRECKGSTLLNKTEKEDERDCTIHNFIDGHKIDYVKRGVAFDLEWNSKDQTFDRDLYALRTFHECGLISVGIIVTRSEKLNLVFDTVPQLNKAGEELGKTVKAKYGASTTWMGKLLYRLNAGRSGGCPVLVFGITPKLIEGWEP